MNICPHCGHEVAEDACLCPNCGKELNPVPPQHNSIQVQNGMGTGCVLSAGAYFFLAPLAYMTQLVQRWPRNYPTMHPYAVFRYGTWLINLVPLLIVGILYFLLRPRFPSFARGLGYCLLVILVLLLWGLAACRQ